MSDGFLGRWSRRKLDARQGKPLEPEPPAPAAAEPPAARPVPAAASQPAPELSAEDQVAAPVQAPAEPLPTLEDVQLLTPQSDFRRFVQPGVAPDVKNAALKKLFADPRFNVQDGLDVYIDDYGKPDPIPPAMLRNLASAQFLGLFREEKPADEPAGQPRDHAEKPAVPSVAQSAHGPGAGDAPASPPEVPSDHAHPDLRLQQDDAAGPGGPGPGTG